jgi:eukaryotic-like serine/threonine-protein kinase
LGARVDRLFPVSADLGPLAAVLEKAGRADPLERASAAEMGRALVQVASSMPRPAPLPIVLSDSTGEVVVSKSDVDPRPEISRVTGSVQGGGETSIPPSVADDPAVGDPEVVVPETSPDVEGRPLVGRWILAALAVLVLLIGGLFLYRTLRDDSDPVPDLTGLDEGSATNAVTEFGWQIVTLEEFSEEIQVGQVVRTEPAAGEDLESGETLTLVISSGPPPVPLPDVVGLDSSSALEVLDGAGLQTNFRETFSEDLEVGLVVRWEVPEQPSLTTGDEVMKGTSVDVFVSQGPEPRTVPNLIGQTYEAATAALDEIRLVIARDEDQFFPDIPIGAIGFQVPAAGEKADRDSQVRVVVSKGQDLVAVPSIRRMNVDQIKVALTNAGLTVAGVTGTPRGTPVALLINGQVVTSGQLVSRGSPVVIAYYR